ncbi:MAG: CHASE2 domain-containing protein, partial [Spirochaetales bacterium]|nr:CHASE2 domain-containing protein [Spirochaetales bacterium]
MEKRLISVIRNSPVVKYFYVMICISVACQIFSFIEKDQFEKWNNVITDQFFRIRYAISGKERISTDLVHINVTDDDIMKLSLSLWERDVYGLLLSIMEKVHVSVSGYDLIFQDYTFLDNDLMIINSLENVQNVFFPIVCRIIHSNEYTVGKYIDSEKVRFNPEIIDPGRPYEVEIGIQPFQELVEKSSGLGHITCTPDSDGRNRYFPLIFKKGDSYIPSLALVMICSYLNIELDSIEVCFGKYILLKNVYKKNDTIKNISIPIDDKGRMILNWAGPWNDSFTNYSFQRVLSAVDDPELMNRLEELINGTVVLVSDVSTRNKDHGPGIFDTVYPLGGIHLTILNSILTENFLVRTGAVVNLTLMFAFLLFLLFVSSFKKPVLFYFFSIIGFTGIFCIGFCIFRFFHKVPFLSLTMIVYAVSFALISLLRLIGSEKEKIRLKMDSIVSKQIREKNDELVLQKTELEKANKKLEEKDKYKTVFIENISHEFITPLQLILNPIEFIKDRQGEISTSLLLEKADNIKFHANRLLSLITQLLDMTRIESGKD